MSEKGWGTFNVPITIWFRPETGLEEERSFDHFLSFNEDGETGRKGQFFVIMSREVLEGLMWK